MDAGFPTEDFLSALEAEDVGYMARIRSNAALERLAAPFLTRPAGRPPRHYRKRQVKGTYNPADSFATNEARLLLCLLAANLLHAGAELLGRATRQKLGRNRSAP